MLAENDIRYKIVPGNSEGINDIAKHILSRLGKKMKVCIGEN